MEGAVAQVVPKPHEQLSRTLARAPVIFREYCIGRTMARYLGRKPLKKSSNQRFVGDDF